MFTEPKSLRVMVADEDEVQRLMIREYLEIVGPYDVLESHGLYHLLATCESALPGIGDSGHEGYPGGWGGSGPGNPAAG